MTQKVGVTIVTINGVAVRFDKLTARSGVAVRFDFTLRQAQGSAHRP